MGLPFTLGRVDVQALRARRRLSVEEAAREARYAFLFETAAGLGASAIALGHTADDQAETLLMHLLRGSGSAGLAGMSAVAHLPSAEHGEHIALVRPLLNVTKAETRAYCQLRSVTPREDSSNRSLELTRNRVRLELLPHMERYNPRIREALLRLSASAALDHEFLAQAAGGSHVAAGVRRRQRGRLNLGGPALQSLHPALQRHLLRLAYRELTGTALGLSHGTRGGNGATFQRQDGRVGGTAGRPQVHCWLRVAEPGA